MLATKHWRIVPEEFKTNELYEMPLDEAILAVKDEKGRRKVFLKQIKEDKKPVQSKLSAGKKKLNSKEGK